MEVTKSCKILIVDDVEMNLVILSSIIESMGHKALTALKVRDAIEILETETPHLILLDVSMPDMNGLDFCKLLKEDVYTRDIPIIFISALDSTEDLSRAFEIGAVDYIPKPFEASNVKMRVSTHLNLYTMQLKLESANRRLNAVIKSQMNSEHEHEELFLKGIAELTAERDLKRSFSGKSESQMARLLTQALQFTPDYEELITDRYIDNLELAAIVHDIGMLKVSDSVLLKEDTLSQEEKMAMRKHVEYGAEKIEKLFSQPKDEDLRVMLKDVVACHHENYDGTGYPAGLKALDIPLSARIMRIIDSYEAMVNDRCYHKAVDSSEAVAEIEKGAGTIYDPGIVPIFVKIQKKFI